MQHREVKVWLWVWSDLSGVEMGLPLFWMLQTVQAFVGVCWCVFVDWLTWQPATNWKPLISLQPDLIIFAELMFLMNAGWMLCLFNCLVFILTPAVGWRSVLNFITGIANIFPYLEIRKCNRVNCEKLPLTPAAQPSLWLSLECFFGKMTCLSIVWLFLSRPPSCLYSLLHF